MTGKEARQLVSGDMVSVIIEVPSSKGAEPDLVPGTVLEFRKIIPKVIIGKRYPWNDSHDEMLFCRRSDGSRAWLCFKNAKKVEEI